MGGRELGGRVTLWVGLDWIEVGWIGLGWIGLRRCEVSGFIV